MPYSYHLQLPGLKLQLASFNRFRDPVPGVNGPFKLHPCPQLILPLKGNILLPHAGKNQVFQHQIVIPELNPRLITESGVLS